MIEIKFRIVDDIKYLANLSAEEIISEGEPEGFFKIEDSNGNAYGYHHSGPLKEGEEGFDLVFLWAHHLLRALVLLISNRYVAIKDIETPDVWIEFEKIEESVRLRAVKSRRESHDASPVISMDKLNDADVLTTFESEPFSLLAREIANKSRNLINDLISINEAFRCTERYKEISEYLNILTDRPRF